MAHYKTESVDFTTLYANYPHSPSDPVQSYQDYLEDNFSQGRSLASFAFRGSSEIYTVFTPNAQ